MSLGKTSNFQRSFLSAEPFFSGLFKKGCNFFLEAWAAMYVLPFFDS